MTSAELRDIVDLSKYFTKDEDTYADKRIVLYNFDDSKCDEFIRDMLMPIREAFVSNEQIEYDLTYEGVTREKAIKGHLPDVPMMKSADFGEALSYYFALCFFDPQPNVCPFKLRYLDDPNKPSPRTDVLFFYVTTPDTLTSNDVFYTIEVKSRATNPGHESGFDEAIEDAYTDLTERSAESINYLLSRMRFAHESKEMHNKVMRFGEPSFDGVYQKYHSALLVTDRRYLQRHIDNITDSTLAKLHTTYAAIHLFCLPIAQLQPMYELFYAQMPNT